MSGRLLSWASAGLAMFTLVCCASCTLAANQSTGPLVRTVIIKHGLYIEPPALEINVGERVSWINDAPGGQVQVQFKKVDGAPDVVGFSPVAQFQRPGRYGYSVTAISPGVGAGDRVVIKLEGTITVRDTPSSGTAAEVPPPRVDRQPPPVVAADLPPSRADVVRVKGGRDAAITYGYQPQQGVLIKIESIAASPPELRAGDYVVLQVQYTILAPPERSQMNVKEVWMISHNNQELTRLEKEAAVTSGTYAIQYRVALPPDAPEGSYTISTLLEVLAVGKPTEDTRTARFAIRGR
jgi:plastocyanin